MFVPENTVSASLIGGELNFSADVQNTSGSTAYEATVEVRATQIGDVRALLWSGTFTETVSPNQTRSVSGVGSVSPDPGTTLEVCAEVISISPIGGGL